MNPLTNADYMAYLAERVSTKKAKLELLATKLVLNDFTSEAEKTGVNGCVHFLAIQIVEIEHAINAWAKQTNLKSLGLNLKKLKITTL